MSAVTRRIVAFALGLALAAAPVVPTSQAAVGQPIWAPSVSVDLGTNELQSMAKAGGYLWVAESWQSGRLFRVNPQSGSFSVVQTGNSGITLQAFEDRLFMAAFTGANPGSIAEISPLTGSVLDRARACPGDRDGPTNFWIDAQEIVVACKSGTVTVLATDGLTPLRTTTLGTWLTGSTVAGEEIWVGSYWGSIYVLDRTSLSVKVTLSGCPEAWTLWTSGSRVLCQGLSSVVAYNGFTRAQEWSVATPVSGYGSFFAPGGLLVAGYHDGHLGMVDTDGGTLLWSHDLVAGDGDLNGAYYDDEAVWVGARGRLLKFPFTAQGDPIDADVAAPALVSADGPAGVVAGDALVVRWRLTDESGVGSTRARMEGPSGYVVPDCGVSAASRVSGSALDGTYSQSCVIPRSAPAGSYSVSVQAVDVLGNLSSGSALRFGVSPPEESPSDPPAESEVFRLEPTSASDNPVEPGSRVTFTSAVFALDPNGAFSRYQGDLTGSLQVQRSGKWLDVRSAKSSNGTLQVTVRLRSSSFFRFHLSDGTVSAPIKVKVLSAAPDQLLVRWPSRVVDRFSVKVLIKKDGKTWTTRERVVLSVKPSGSGRWVRVDAGQTRRGKVTLSTDQLKSGTWKVAVRKHGLEDLRVYGGA